MLRYSMIAFAVLLMVACSGGATRNAEQRGKEKQKFPYPTIPLGVSAESGHAYLTAHFWDGVDLRDSVTVARMDTMEMVNAFASYVSLLNREPCNQQPMRELMAKIRHSRYLVNYFAMLGDQVLGDPNSPLRNDEMYIPVLEARLDVCSEYEAMAVAYKLDRISRNRPGSVAADFRYTLLSGKTGSMHRLRADYLLLFFNNPGCGMCGDVKAALQQSACLSELLDEGRLKILVVYPDEDLKSWRDYASDFPADWIYSCEKEGRIHREGIYYISAIPSLYLLDGEKRVLEKDVTDVGRIEWRIGLEEQKRTK